MLSAVVVVSLQPQVMPRGKGSLKECRLSNSLLHQVSASESSVKIDPAIVEISRHKETDRDKQK